MSPRRALCTESQSNRICLSSSTATVASTGFVVVLIVLLVALVGDQLFLARSCVSRHVDRVHDIGVLMTCLSSHNLSI